MNTPSTNEFVCHGINKVHAVRRNMDEVEEKAVENVKLRCGVYGEGTVFPVEIKPDADMEALQEAIFDKKRYKERYSFAASDLTLYLAKQDGAWLKDDDNVDVLLQEKIDTVYKKMRPSWKLNKEELLGPDFQPGEKEIHVLVELSEAAAGVTSSQDVKELVKASVGELRRYSTLGVDEQPAHKKAKTSTVIKDEDIKLIGQNLDIDAWQVGGISLDIRRVESDFPDWFYVRKETLDIIRIFMEAKLNTVFVGTPGVVKSLLVVLFAFYMAVHVVHGCREQATLANGRAEIMNLDLVVNRDFELCLDGLEYDDVRTHFEKFARFRLLATSAQYPMKNDDTPVLQRCLVPFWSLSDLNVIGAHRGWTEHEIKNQYFSSGGNLCDFSAAYKKVKNSIDQAIRLVNLEDAQLRNTQYGGASVRQVDRLRMTGIRANDHRDVDEYLYCRHWICVVTSEYALQRLGNIVQPTYYEELWAKGRMLGDDGLMDIAFENYVHTLARDGKKIELQVRAYDRAKAGQHTYAAVGLENKSWRSDGMNAAECDAIMKVLPTSNVDYWYPSSRSLVTINCVAKLSIAGRRDAVGLIQITKSDHHKIDSVALDKYAKIFPGRSRYIVLVPDKDTCDEFRLSPADPPTNVPLDVAYITTWGN